MMKNKNIYLLGGLLIIIGIILYNFISSISDTDVDSVEHKIIVRSDDKEIEAFTGSFCYKNVCIDKIDFEDVKYDMISSYYGNKLYIYNLDGNINSIELYDYGMKEFTNTEVEYTNEYIITPSISGAYIFKINATYNGKKIEYYFMSQISKTNGESVDVRLEIKDGSLSNSGLTMIMSNLSDIDLEYGTPFSIEKYENGYWKSVETINAVAYNLIAYSLNKNEVKEIEINWEYGYGKLNGKYRIVKNFQYLDGEEYISFNKYLEFEL